MTTRSTQIKPCRQTSTGRGMLHPGKEAASLGEGGGVCVAREAIAFLRWEGCEMTVWGREASRNARGLSSLLPFASLIEPIEERISTRTPAFCSLVDMYVRGASIRSAGAGVSRRFQSRHPRPRSESMGPPSSSASVPFMAKVFFYDDDDGQNAKQGSQQPKSHTIRYFKRGSSNNRMLRSTTEERWRSRSGHSTIPRRQPAWWLAAAGSSGLGRLR